MPEPIQSRAALERLRILSEEASANKGKLSPDARREAVHLLTSLWRDLAVSPLQILDSAERVRGGDIASSLAPVWPDLPQERQQTIVKSMVDRPVEATGRNVYAAAAIIEHTPDLSVDLLQTARDNKETVERLHVAFFKQSPELLRALASAQAAQYKLRNVFNLLVNVLLQYNYKPGSPADRAVIEPLVAYVATNSLLRDSTFGKLIDRARSRIAEWPPDSRRDMDLRLADIPQPSELASPGVPTVPVEPSSAPQIVHQDAAPAEICPAGDLNLASVLAKLRDRASVAGRESVELKAQSERAAELADLLNSVAEAITGRVRDRDALLEAQRQLDDKHASLLETERRLTKSQELGGEFREENLGLRKRLEAFECTEAAQAGRLSELTRKCQELEIAAELQRTGALDQMQKYAQTRLEEFRSGLARALHPSVHDLPQTLAELPPDLAGVIAIRLEQVIRELERHQIPLRSKREATG